MDLIESKRFKELSEKRYLNDYEDKEIKKLRDLLEQRVIKESNVVFSTLDSSGKSSIVKNISTLIVDEAVNKKKRKIIVREQ